MAELKIYAHIDYEDSYVQPLILKALRSRLSSEVLALVNKRTELPENAPLLEWLQYENIDFDGLLQHPTSRIANSFVIRKALIRKHYLSNTISHWLAKRPKARLHQHVKPSVQFEVDYAEFLDEALVEAYELKQSWDRNACKTVDDQEWWILKPGMSDRGQGIRLFNNEEQLTAIFEEWDPPSEDEEGNSDQEAGASVVESQANESEDHHADGVMASQLRHFVAQPYIHPPLLLSPPHTSAERKFHIRTYVLAVGALQVYVYRPMLALFAAHRYEAPSLSTSPNENLSQHLTNTCLQTGEREGSVHSFWSLPTTGEELSSEHDDWREEVFEQICALSGEVFEAAARTMSIHFQPLPNAFELFGLDFLVDAQGTAWLLEINAFPDFAQTGEELQDLVSGLFEQVVDIAIKPFFNISSNKEQESQPAKMRKVLDIDLGRH